MPSKVVWTNAAWSDYGYWQGSRRAVDEFIASRKDPIFLHRIDLTARMIIKSLAS